MSQFADVEGAARVARVGAGFEWTWTRGDFAGFCAATGFREERGSVLGVVLRSDLDVGRREVYVFTDRGDATDIARAGQEIEDIVMCAADLAEVAAGDMKAEVARHYSVLCDRLVAELGLPTRSGAREVLWDRPRVVISLAPLDNSVALSFTNPIYQEWDDAQAMAEY
ncbi:DUF6301 family protein [Nocardia sp. NPDC050406]|uniref:DUF6301 family protein n=1 Tax=Nocardia sp. NPDC050406 TaxID=3364318 RepID=UPI0037B60886